MDRLPILASVPHAGLSVPDEVVDLHKLSPEQIAADGDVGAAEIYAFEDCVAKYVTTAVARAFVDMNRAEDDLSRDGVVKTHTCWNEEIYDSPLEAPLVERLLERYYRPYHTALADDDSDLILGIDLHTMAAAGPPVGPDPGVERPGVCVSNADGTCPQEWIEVLRTLLERELDCEARINDPFRGGYITRTHAKRRPWIQLELSRAPWCSNEKKRSGVLEALRRLCQSL